MSEEEVTGTEEIQQDELSMLKERADIMGIVYHPNIGLEKLKAKIAEKQAPKEEPPQDPQMAQAAADEVASIDEAELVAKQAAKAPKAAPTPAQQKAARKREATRLVRIRVTNMNPIKGNLKGEIMSVGNSEIGFVKKFIPFNAEQGWHVPKIILTQLQNKKYMAHYETKVGNKKVMRNKLVPEYSIEILPPLTKKELDELKQRQIIAASGQ